MSLTFYFKTFLIYLLTCHTCQLLLNPKILLVCESSLCFVIWNTVNHEKLKMQWIMKTNINLIFAFTKTGLHTQAHNCKIKQDPTL